MNTCVPPGMGPHVEAQWGGLCPLHVSFVVVCEEGGLGHREMVGAHCLLPSCPQLVCCYFPFRAVLRAAARGLTLCGL